MAKNSGYTEKAGLLFSARLNKAVSIILTKSLALKEKESLLILYDPSRSQLANLFERAASALTHKVHPVKIPGMKVSGEEPPLKIARKIKQHDVAIFLTEKSLSHTRARRRATKAGTRIASMPGITSGILARSIDINYRKLKSRTRQLAILLNKAKRVRVKTSLGSDISFSIEGRKAHGLSAGIYSRKGKWGNLPEGEVFIAPLEGTAEGHFVVDGSIACFGKLQHPLIFFVKKGIVTKITNGKKPHEIEKLLDEAGELSRNIAEFGIGLNRKAKVTGLVLEDEKAYGTCHIALGNNIGFGGKVEVPLHIDCVIRKPSVWLDNRIIMKRGKLRK